MNWETIVVALIAALGPLIGTIISNSQQKTLIQLKLDSVEKSVNSLSEKVEKHNNFDRRLIVIETKLGIDKKEKNA
ncbi:MAG: hypothetical protein J6Y48_12645 [Clostridia bacterium]|nr:hypothetical protein [Clostridia bacterium]